MNRYSAAVAVTVLTLGSVSIAHQGVQNPVVAARMDGMTAIADQMKIIGHMARGERVFDADLAQQAAISIAGEAARIPVLFAEPANDPLSEAQPGIWDDFTSFTAMATELEVAATGLAACIDAPDDLSLALATLGRTCKSCHQRFRE